MKKLSEIHCLLLIGGFTNALITAHVINLNELEPQNVVHVTASGFNNGTHVIQLNPNGIPNNLYQAPARTPTPTTTTTPPSQNSSLHPVFTSNSPTTHYHSTPPPPPVVQEPPSFTSKIKTDIKNKIKKLPQTEQADLTKEYNALQKQIKKITPAEKAAIKKNVGMYEKDVQDKIDALSTTQKAAIKNNIVAEKRRIKDLTAAQKTTIKNDVTNDLKEEQKKIQALTPAQRAAEHKIIKKALQTQIATYKADRQKRNEQDLPFP